MEDFLLFRNRKTNLILLWRGLEWNVQAPRENGFGEGGLHGPHFYQHPCSKDFHPLHFGSIHKFAIKYNTTLTFGFVIHNESPSYTEILVRCQ